jgi:hypothetical protein
VGSTSTSRNPCFILLLLTITIYHQAWACAQIVANRECAFQTMAHYKVIPNLLEQVWGERLLSSVVPVPEQFSQLGTVLFQLRTGQ